MALRTVYIVIETHEEQDITTGKDSHVSAIRAVFADEYDAGAYAVEQVKRLEDLTKSARRSLPVSSARESPAERERRESREKYAGSYRGTETGNRVGNEVMAWQVYWKGWTGYVVEEHKIVLQGHRGEAEYPMPIHG